MFLQNFGLAVDCYLKSIPLLFSFRFRRYVIYSSIISVVLFAGLVLSLWALSASLASYLLEMLPYQPEWATLVLTWLLKFAGWFVVVQFYKYIILIFLSPVLSVLSEKIEMHESGGQQISENSFWKSLPRSLKINSINLVKELALTCLLFLLSFIPGMLLFTGPLMLLTQFYFIGFGILDFYFERYLSYRATKEEVWSNLFFTLLTGCIFLFLFALPVIGAVAAPLICTAASTLYLMNRPD
jgi:CysZ protein